MSTRYEWIGAGDAGVIELAPGEPAEDGGEVEEGQIAVIAAQFDNGIAVIGTPEEVRDLLTRMVAESFLAEGRMRGEAFKRQMSDATKEVAP